jgi:hypothetical protein
MDLFTPVIEPQNFHPNFRTLLSNYSRADREVLAQWADGFVDRDGKFVQEFQKTFNSSFWELYLFACCKELSLRINFGFSSPDFVVDNFLSEFCMEAVIASNALGKVPEWETDLKNPPNPEQVLDNAVIRLCNTIHGKHKKYLKNYSLMQHVKERPFVIAVGSFEQPYFWIQNDHAIRQVLYGYDRLGSDGKHTFRMEIEKPSANQSTAPIELGLFTSSKMASISAVVFSNTATMSKLHALNSDKNSLVWFSALRFNAKGKEPFLEEAAKSDYQESILDGLYVFHNPHADNPLPHSYFNHDDVTQARLFAGESLPRYKCKHGHLIQRTSFSLRPK